MIDYLEFAVGQIKAVREQLAKDNALAREREWELFLRDLDAMISEHGAYNVFGAVIERFRQREFAAPEGSTAEADWRSAADQLESLKLDLLYK